ncbi:DER1-domain-containing protein [Eremomyces bilateralis CBS 781.70]|uniref:Derlin n=1 Tax=Eremomyces bilateralis CBS 781.70 TaxID=1392243 RepID=A0A6G1G643_9PEZI|nr:DER1-domain-containing protein [Eremomyces bilateralis CBS 781.70]KAF1813533.1 DER1-domain-containing protein [Eremomyces bilateralis CBS 781.70]
MDVFWAAPPVSRTITAFSFVMSTLSHTGFLFLDPGSLVFFPPLVFGKLPPELWRVVTSCFLTRGGLALLFEPYMLYQYASGLERESSRFPNPGDFFIFLIFLCTVIIGLAYTILGAEMFLPALILALAYTFAQDNPDRQVNVIFINMPAKFMPYAMLFLTYIVVGPYMMYVEITGLVAAHLYNFLTKIWPAFGGGTNIIKTPGFVSRWFGGGSPQARSFGMAYPGRVTAAQNQPGSGSGSGFGGFGSAWQRRGGGRRLGE